MQPKTLTRLSLMAGLAMASASTALAAPAAYVPSHCGHESINNPTDSAVYRDNKDCGSYWVLPPNTGKTKLYGFTPSGGLSYCGQIKDTFKMQRDLNKKRAQLVKQLDPHDKKYGELNEKLAQAEEAAAKVKASPAMQEVLAVQNELNRIYTSISETLTALNSCTNACESLTKEYNQLVELRNQKSQELSDLRMTNYKDVQKSMQADALVESIRSQIQNTNARRQYYYDQITLLDRMLADALEKPAKILGGTAHVDYKLNWTENIKKLKDLNPRANFKKMPTYNARIHANISSAEDHQTYMDSMPAILGYSIAGLKTLPWGANDLTLQSALPEHISGTFNLTAIGACPLQYEDFFSDKDLKQSDQPQSNVEYGISATFQYPATFNYKVTAKYNLYKFYEVIKKSSTRGGFFSSKTVRSVSEKKLSKDTFEIHWEEDDPMSLTPADKRREIEAAIKADLVGRVLTQIATPVPGDGAAPPPLPPTKASGAVIVSRYVPRACGFFSFSCGHSGWILKSVGAIFGGGSSESRFRSESDHTAVDKYHEEITRLRGGTVSFERGKE